MKSYLACLIESLACVETARQRAMVERAVMAELQRQQGLQK